MGKGSAIRRNGIAQDKFAERYDATHGTKRFGREPCPRCSRPGRLVYHASKCKKLGDAMAQDKFAELYDATFKT